ncbi:hypothetical protein F4779DRAFT_600010 [Xylariaceae sp. FL0662B]|nr:hypothetical protein F4779DRAFT_600010 [Xylariaceae sp. FL0662B]
MNPLAEVDPNAPNGSSNIRTDPSMQPGNENNHVGKQKPVSRKRKSDAVEVPDNPPEIDDDDPRIFEVIMTPNQVRRKIRDFIDGGNMKVGELQHALNVTSTSYQRFMRMRGVNDGSETDMYPRAFTFFRKRELQGLRAAPPKKPRKSEQNKVLDVSGVTLDRQDSQEVPVYDTCDEVRRKIRAFLRKPDVSQQAFCRAISGSFPEGRRIQASQLNSFLAKKGPMSGNTSSVFYGSYVFFEKMRIKEGKPKSKMREEMEKIHPHGVNTTEIEQYWTCMADERPVTDEYGVTHFVKTRGRAY